MKTDYVFRRIDYHGANVRKANLVYEQLREKFEDGALDFQTRQLKAADDDLLNKSKESGKSESQTHRELKAYAATHIRKLGGEPEFEKGCWYGVADVASEDKTILAEIGKISVDKLLSAFGCSTNSQFFGERYDRYPSAERFLLLPYSMNSDSPPARAIELWRN